MLRFNILPPDISYSINISAFPIRTTTMRIWFSTIVISLSILCLSSLTQGQQTYYGFSPGNCAHEGNSVLGYSCNGVNKSCAAYLIFRARRPYNTISSISNLLHSDPTELSEINSVSVNASIETDRMVIVPVNCSCSGEYYQAYAFYSAQPGDTYLFISNNTFQGLSSCESLISQNGGGTLEANTMVTVPLRCACPTTNQRDAGIKYLLTYDVTSGDTYEAISDKFGVDNNLLLKANNVSQDITIFPFTTLLIPLQNPPNSSMTVLPPSTPPPLPPPTSPPDSGSKKTWIYVVVGVIAAVVVVFISGIIYCAFVRKKDRQGDSTIISGKLKGLGKPIEKIKPDQEPEDILESLHNFAQSMKVYNFDELQSATDNFSDEYWIRGSVYRGIFNGDMATIKKLSGDVSNEVTFMKKTNHLNLVKLVGVCFNDGHWYLVYEYATNGSLDEWIYYNRKDGEKFLSWTKRIQIALDVATGLNYLHSFTNPPHVHMDINSSNILLDSDFRAKISNFGRARSAEGREGQFTLTRHIVGTRGYMAPEYLDHGLVSPKLDIYALGVMMFEVLTGKEAADFCGKGNADLSDFLNSMLQKSGGEDSLEDLIDPSMQGSYPSELVLFIFTLIDSCIKKNPAARPDINELVQSISKVLNSSFSWEMSKEVTGNKNLS